ncbi:MAG: DUF1275 domain-containing protein [Oscillospiraceae bacterium]|nr:DUF1275 domain-containing protein [Oscillospiraceae bacterium]
MSKTTRTPEHEKRWVFLLLIFVAGFYGGYTLCVRGGVFCNGQTGNLALLGMALGSGNWMKAIYYLIPISSYMIGIMVSEVIPRQLRWYRMRWDTLLTLIEIVLVIIIGFIPANAPHQICQVTINFICAMQYNTFRQSEGFTMATTFCVNHMRVVGTAVSRILTRKECDPEQVERIKAHGGMLASFVLGATVSAALCCLFSVYAIWFVLIPLVILAIDLLRADMA